MARDSGAPYRHTERTGATLELAIHQVTATLELAIHQVTVEQDGTCGTFSDVIDGSARDFGVVRGTGRNGKYPYLRLASRSQCNRGVDRVPAKTPVSRRPRRAPYPSARWPRVSSALDRARGVQELLLPGLPALSGLRVGVAYRPAYELSGDFYDVVELDDGRAFAIIGDVAGHDIDAALLMSRASAEFRRAFDRGPSSPEAVMSSVNEALVAVGAEQFVTAVCVELSADRRLARLANAGHVPPMLVRGDTSWAIGDARGAPLGLFEDEPYPVEAVSLRSGDLMFLMTDGVAEALEPSGRVDPATLMEILDSEARDLVMSIARLFVPVDAREHRDDATVVAVEVA